MKKVSLCYCLKPDQILLAWKKRGIGFDKWNGYGGKFIDGESSRTATVRETLEEIVVRIEESALKQVALIRFSFEGVPTFECHVFLTEVWQGEPQETDEMRPQWFSRSAIPYAQMWSADIMWLPMVLAGQTIEGNVNFNKDGSLVNEFRYKPATFE